MISFRTAGSGGGAPYASAKLALLCAILGSAWAARSIFNPLLDLAKADLAISDMHVGLLQGIALSLPAALLSIPVGRMIDTRSRVLLLVGLAAATMLGSVATALASSFTDLFVYRGLTGLGIMEEAVVLSLAADLFPPERRGRVTALIILAEYFGNALGLVFAGWLLPVASFMPLFTGAGEWRMAPFLFGLAGLLLALPLLWMQEPPRRETMPGTGAASLAKGFVALNAFGRLLWPLLAAQVATIMAGNMASVWAVPVLARDFGLGEAEGGQLVAAILLVPPLLGALAAGILADRGSGRGGAMVIAAAASLLALPGAAFPVVDSVHVSAALLALLVAGQTAALLGASAISILVLPNDIRGLWFGISGVMTMVFGFALAPSLAPWLAAGTGGELSSALAWLLFLCGICAAIGFTLALRQHAAEGAGGRGPFSSQR